MEQQITDLKGDFADVKKDVREIRDSFHKLELALSKIPICASPGLCIPMQSELRDHKSNVASLESDIVKLKTEVAEARGGIKATAWWTALISSPAAALATVMIEHWLNK